jgi:hypothetical protein
VACCAAPCSILNQEFNYDTSGRLKMSHTGMCITYIAGVDARQYSCTNDIDQKWTLRPAPNGLYQIESQAAPNMCWVVGLPPADQSVFLEACDAASPSAEHMLFQLDIAPYARLKLLIEPPAGQPQVNVTHFEFALFTAARNVNFYMSRPGTPCCEATIATSLPNAPAANSIMALWDTPDRGALYAHLDGTHDGTGSIMAKLLIYSRVPCGSTVIIYSGSYETGQSPAWTWGGTANDAPYIYACPTLGSTDPRMAAWVDGSNNILPTAKTSNVLCCTPPPAAPATLRIKRANGGVCVDYEDLTSPPVISAACSQ